MKKESKYAIFNYKENDEDLVSNISSYLDMYASKILSFFNYDNVFVKCCINIYESKDEFDEKIKKIRCNNKDIPKWLVGVTTFSNSIELVSLSDYKNTSHKFNTSLIDYQKTVLHEYVHFVNFLYCRENGYEYPLKCLQEGLAMVLASPRNKSIEDFNYSYDDIVNSNNCYDGWFLLVKYIFDNYDKSYFFSLLKDGDFAKKEIKKIMMNIE